MVMWSIDGLVVCYSIPQEVDEPDTTFLTQAQVDAPNTTQAWAEPGQVASWPQHPHSHTTDSVLTLNSHGNPDFMTKLCIIVCIFLLNIYKNTTNHVFIHNLILSKGWTLTFVLKKYIVSHP